jgi:hypothetical protein
MNFCLSRFCAAYLRRTILSPMVAPGDMPVLILPEKYCDTATYEKRANPWEPVSLSTSRASPV